MYNSGGTTSHAQSSESCETKSGVGLGLFSRLHFHRALSLVTCDLWNWGEGHVMRATGTCLLVSDVPQDSPSPTDVFQYSPHSRGISGMVFPRSPSSPLVYTCSYDGTLRCADLERGVFDEVR